MYQDYRRAEFLFSLRDYLGAARVLETLLDDAARDGVRHGTGDARELLARSYYHSARLGKAEDAARALLDDDPTNAYAALLLTRTLERRSRHEDAAGARRYAAALDATPDAR